MGISTTLRSTTQRYFQKWDKQRRCVRCDIASNEAIRLKEGIQINKFNKSSTQEISCYP